MRKKKAASIKAEIRQILMEFADKSTIAGLHYAFNRKQVFLHNSNINLRLFASICVARFLSKL